MASFYGNRGSRESYSDGYGAAMNSAGPSRPRYNPRMQSEPILGRHNGVANGANGHGVYNGNGYQQSRDTVNTGVSNGSQSDPMGYSTDPSSDNSSLDRPTPPQKHLEPVDNYGFSGFGGAPQYNGPILEEYSTHHNQNQDPPGPASYGQHSRGPPPPTANGQYRQNPLPPLPPPHGAPPVNKYGGGVHHTGMRTGGATAPPPQQQHQQYQQQQQKQQAQPALLQRGGSEKRKSWFKRRFSKS